MVHCLRDRLHRNLRVQGLGISMRSPITAQISSPDFNTTQSRHRWSRAVSLCLRTRLSDTDQFVWVVSRYRSTAVMSLTPGKGELAPYTAAVNNNIWFNNRKTPHWKPNQNETPTLEGMLWWCITSLLYWSADLEHGRRHYILSLKHSVVRVRMCVRMRWRLLADERNNAEEQSINSYTQ